MGRGLKRPGRPATTGPAGRARPASPTIVRPVGGGARAHRRRRRAGRPRPRTSTSLLRVPDRLLEVAVPVRMDDGHVEVFKGWRIHHDTVPGPGQGGDPVPPHPAGRGGGRPGGRHDAQDGGRQRPLRRRQGRRALRPPAACRPGELERLTRRYTFEIARHPRARPRHPRPRRQHRRAGDGLAHGHPRHARGAAPAGVVTGKPLAVGGMRLHTGATASGVVRCVRAVVRRARHARGRGPGRGPGLRQGGRAPRLPAVVGRHAGRGRRRRRPARCTTPGGST